jgi:hypothetical protein
MLHIIGQLIVGLIIGAIARLLTFSASFSKHKIFDGMMKITIIIKNHSVPQN